MFFDRLLGEADPVTDLLVLQTLGHECQHNGLPIGQTPAADAAALVSEPEDTFNYT